MRYTIKKGFIISLTIICLIFQSLAASENTIQEPLKILFIGSSYFNYNDMPGIFENLTNSSGKEIYIDRQITSGFLADHAERSSTESKINEKKWDYVILQGVGSLTAYPEYYTDHQVYPALVTLHNKIKKNSESTKMLFCLPWAFEDGMSWKEGWTDLYEDMQIKIYENTLKYTDDLDFEISPVGWAWYMVLKEKNYPLHYLHMSDWNHPSPKGSYLMACVIYSTIFKESSSNISYYNGLPEEEAVYFQSIGSNTVLDSLELWNITITHTEFSEFSIPHQFHLNQNYPNPFNPSTAISYLIPKHSTVYLKIFDVMGKEVKTLVNEFTPPGNYEIEFVASTLPSGVYFYRLQSSNFSETKKLILLR